MKTICATIKILFITACFIGFFSSAAQNWQWATSPDADGEGLLVCNDAAGNVFIIGRYSTSLVAGNYTLNAGVVQNIYLIKYNSAGAVQWAKTAVTSTVPDIYGVSADQAGNSFITGAFSGTIAFDSYTLTASGPTSAYVVKYDPNGNVLWARSSTGSQSDEGDAVCTDSFGNVYVGGDFSSPIISFGTCTLSQNGTANSFVVKYDPNGNALWARGTGGSAICQIESVSCDANGDFYATGVFTSSVVTFGTYSVSNTGSYDVFLAKYDPNGNILWAKSAIGSGNDWAYSVSTSGASDVYLTGTYSSPITFGTSTLSIPGGNYFLIKYDNGGNVQWARSSISTGIFYSSSGAYLNGVFICGGMNQSGQQLVAGNYTITPPAGYTDPMFFIGYDPNGNVTHAEALGSGGDDEIGVSVDKFCNAYISGDFIPNPYTIGSNTIIPTGGESIFTAKFTFSCQNNPDGIAEQSNSHIRFQVYPNPNNGSFEIQSNYEIKNCELILTNLLGQQVYSQKAEGKINQFKISGFSAGLYYCHLLQEGKKVISQPLIIKD